VFVYRPGRWVRFLIWIAARDHSAGAVALAFMFATVEETRQRYEHDLWTIWSAPLSR